MNTVFNIVYLLLAWLSKTTGLSYKEVNIIIYYFILPAMYVLLIDIIIKRYICSLCFVLAWGLILILVHDFGRFSNRLFDISVNILNAFAFLGWNYTVASVIICVILPGLLFLALIYSAFRKAPF